MTKLLDVPTPVLSTRIVWFKSSGKTNCPRINLNWTFFISFPMPDSGRIVYLHKASVIETTLYTSSSSCCTSLLLYLSSTGCYPRCPADKPVYNEDTKECVTADQCGCYVNGTYVPVWNETVTEDNCTKWYIKKCRTFCSNSGRNLCTLSPSFTSLGLKQIEMQFSWRPGIFYHVSTQIRGAKPFIPV